MEFFAYYKPQQSTSEYGVYWKRNDPATSCSLFRVARGKLTDWQWSKIFSFHAFGVVPVHVSESGNRTRGTLLFSGATRQSTVLHVALWHSSRVFPFSVTMVALTSSRPHCTNIPIVVVLYFFFVVYRRPIRSRASQRAVGIPVHLLCLGKAYPRNHSSECSNEAPERQSQKRLLSTDDTGSWERWLGTAVCVLRLPDTDAGYSTTAPVLRAQT